MVHITVSYTMRKMRLLGCIAHRKVAVGDFRSSSVNKIVKYLMANSMIHTARTEFVEEEIN